MTVKELIEELKELPEDMIVYRSDTEESEEVTGVYTKKLSDFYVHAGETVAMIC